MAQVEQNASVDAEEVKMSNSLLTVIDCVQLQQANIFSQSNYQFCETILQKLGFEKNQTHLKFNPINVTETETKLELVNLNINSKIISLAVEASNVIFWSKIDESKWDKCEKIEKELSDLVQFCKTKGDLILAKQILYFALEPQSLQRRNQWKIFQIDWKVRQMYLQKYNVPKRFHSTFDTFGEIAVMKEESPCYFAAKVEKFATTDMVQLINEKKQAVGEMRVRMKQNANIGIEKEWTCLRCDTKHKYNKISNMTCPNCCEGMNPLVFAVSNRSKTFSVTHPFGINVIFFGMDAKKGQVALADYKAEQDEDIDEDIDEDKNANGIKDFATEVKQLFTNYSALFVIIAGIMASGIFAVWSGLLQDLLESIYLMGLSTTAVGIIGFLLGLMAMVGTFNKNVNERANEDEKEQDLNLEIVINMCDMFIFEYVCDAAKYDTTIDELKQVIFEMWNYCMNPRFKIVSQYDYVIFENIFDKLNGNDIITAQVMPYCVKLNQDFFVDRSIKSGKKYDIRDGNLDQQCEYVQQEKPCPIVINAKRILAGIQVDSNSYSVDEKASILNHLSIYDHFETSSQCEQGKLCQVYQKRLKNVRNMNIEDLIHWHLYKHPPRTRNYIPITISSNNDNDDNDDNDAASVSPAKTMTNSSISSEHEDNNSETIFRYLESYKDIQQSINLDLKKNDQNIIKTSHSQLFLYLIQEVIDNGFEKDLLPDETQEFDFMSCYKQYINKLGNIGSDVELDQVMDILEKHYDIITILKEKMNHPRHKLTNFVLKYDQMLALLLYTSGDCSSNFCLSQRDGSFEKKWFYLDNRVNSAIHMLSKFEASHGTIYTGLCDISLRLDKRKLKQIVGFKTNVSFTTDYQVAEEFRGSNGIIIQLDTAKSFWIKQEKFGLCDVSWISEFPQEKEILVQRLSILTVYTNKVHQSDANQTIVCNDW